MRCLLFLWLLLASVLIGCNIDTSRVKRPDASKLLDSVLVITGNFPDGVNQSGRMSGVSSFFFDGRRLKVESSVMGLFRREFAAERGVVESLTLTSDGADSTYAIRGKWNRDDKYSADADFVLRCAGDEYPNRIYCSVYIQSGGWSYFAYKDVGATNYQRIVKLMRSKEPRPYQEKLSTRQVAPANSKSEPLGFDGATNVMLSDVLGHWVAEAQDCDSEGGLWIEMHGDSTRMGWWEGHGMALYSRHVEDRTYVTLRTVEEGEEGTMEIQLGMRQGRLVLNPEFGRYCCGDGVALLLRCPKANSE